MSNPNVFRDGYLSEHDLAQQMAVVSGRQGARYGDGPGRASWTTMFDQSINSDVEYEYPFVADAIRQTMRAQEFPILYDSRATHIAVVRNTARDGLAGAALLEHGTLYLHDGRVVEEPSVKVLGFGVDHKVGDRRIDMRILEALALQIISVADTIANETMRHRATRLAQRYQPTIEIISHNIMQNTVVAEKSNAALERFAAALNKVELTTPKTGGGEQGFGSILAKAYNELNAMGQAHPEHAFIQSIVKCPTMQRLKMLGGTDSEYEPVQKIVTTMLRLIGAIQLGVNNYFGQLNPEPPTQNVDIQTDSKELANGAISLKATINAGVDSVGSAKFTPENLEDERPEVVFDMTKGTDALSELAAGVIDNVTKGPWWQKQLKKKG